MMFFKTIKNGVIGGLSGGLIFGMMMGMMGMLPMIGKMFGVPNILGGFLVHMLISAMIGAGYGILAGSRINSSRGGIFSGLAYGAGWWLLGPLTIMPAMMGLGLGVNWNPAAAGKMLPSLMGHLVFGLIMGVVYARATTGSQVLVTRRDNPPVSVVQGRAL